MHCRFLPLLALAAVAACASSASTMGVRDGGAASDAGLAMAADEKLHDSDLVGARTAFRAALEAAPADTHAAFGAALAEAVLLPDDPSLTSLLDLCTLPHLDVAGQIFGPRGTLARDHDARQGDGSFTVSTRQGQAGSWTPAGFKPSSFRTSAPSSETGKWLAIRVLDTSAARSSSAELLLEASYANVAGWGLPARALVNGLSIPAAEFGGALSFSRPSADGLVWDYFDRPVSGTIVFRQVGTGATGDAIEVELKDVVLEGAPRCSSVCGPDDWRYVKLSGTTRDTVTLTPKIDLPFDTIAEDNATPHRSATVVLIERCPGISAELLRDHLLTFLGSVDQISSHLDVVLQDPNAEAFQFRVPGALLYVDGEIPLNITDARVAKVVVDLALAVGHGVTQYRTLAKRFEDLIADYYFWVDSGSGPQPTRERGFLVSKLADELNAVFLDREPGFSLTPARTWLITTLDDAAAALSREPKNAGVFNFQTANSRQFAADLGAQIEFVRTSLGSPVAQPFPHAPDFHLSLRAVFDPPLDLVSLHNASTDHKGLFLVHAGDPAAPWAHDRNDWLDVDQDGVRKLEELVLQQPVSLSDKACSQSQPCPGQYQCLADYGSPDSHCQLPDFVLLDKDALKRAVPSSGDPAFFSSEALRPLQVITQ